MSSEAKPPSEPSGSDKPSPGEVIFGGHRVSPPPGLEKIEQYLPKFREIPEVPEATKGEGSEIFKKTEREVHTSTEGEANRETPRLTSDLLLDLIALVGGKKPALLIPANSSEPVTQTDFDPDKLWQYDIAIYDLDKVALTKKNAQLNHEFANFLATKYVKERSDAAKGLDDRLDTPKELYGDIYILPYDQVLEIITGLEGRLNRLKHSLEWLAPPQKIQLTP